MPIPILSKQKLTEFSRLQEKKYRREFGLFLIEGTRLFREFIESDFELVWVVMAPDFPQKFPDIYKTVLRHYEDRSYMSSEPELRKLSDTENTQGIVAAIRQRKSEPFLWNNSGNSRIVVACDRIADPGNLGTILRCADWFGVRDIVLNVSCVEMHNPKTVRATMGSIFRLNIFENQDLSILLTSAKQEGYHVLAADTSGNRISASDQKSKKILIIGSEAHGVSEELLGLCDYKLAVPRIGGGESLNAAVACGILLHELTRSDL